MPLIRSRVVRVHLAAERRDVVAAHASTGYRLPPVRWDDAEWRPWRPRRRRSRLEALDCAVVRRGRLGDRPVRRLRAARARRPRDRRAGSRVRADPARSTTSSSTPSATARSPRSRSRGAARRDAPDVGSRPCGERVADRRLPRAVGRRRAGSAAATRRSGLAYDELIERTADGIPYVRPEVALLFKAKAHRRTNDLDACCRSSLVTRALLAVDRARAPGPWLGASLIGTSRRSTDVARRCSILFERRRPRGSRGSPSP